MDIIRKGAALFLCLALLLTGCSGKNSRKTDENLVIETSGNNNYTSETETKEPEELTTENIISEDITEEVTTESIDVVDNGDVSNYGYVIPELNYASKNIPDNQSMKFAQGMKIGWNLGNTFDGYTDNPWFEGELLYESAWCGIITTPEMIKAVKDAGFNTIRIPVSWHNHVSGEDYVISEEWMNRVQEVVDYAIELDMYVIINTHHDIFSGNEQGSLGQCFIYPSYEYYETSKAYLTSVWTQISERFKDYDEHLIFESMNEPRLTGTTYEWWMDAYSDECNEAVDCINMLNQDFVDVVRSSGGNNPERYLLIPGYCSSYDGATHINFKLPQDTAKDKLMVVVHAYTPYSFALQSEHDNGSESTFDVSDSTDTQEIEYIMSSLYDKYISKGIPVIIDEFGARRKTSSADMDNTQARINYAAYYIAIARANGIICCWWDNNSFNSEGEDFGLLNRAGLIWSYPDIVKALMTY